VLCDYVSGGLRATLHARVGASLETVHGSQASDIAAELAMHFERSGDTVRLAEGYVEVRSLGPG